MPLPLVTQPQDENPAFEFVRQDGLSILRNRLTGRPLYGWSVRADERVVVFNTGAAQKYLEALPADLPRLAKGADVAAAVGR